MRRADERKGRSGTEIDQNQTGVQSTSGHRGKECCPCMAGHAQWSCLTGLQIERRPEE